MKMINNSKILNCKNLYTCYIRVNIGHVHSFCFSRCKYFIDLRMTSNNNNKTYRKKGNVIYCILSGNSFCYPVHINTCQGIAESLQVMTIPIEQKNVDRSNAQMTTG